MISASTAPEPAPEPEVLAPAAFRQLLDGRLAQVFDYWSARRRAGALPSRQDIEPGELTRLLPWLYLLEPGPQGLKVRLAGTRIRELFDCELTGSDLLKTLPEPFAGNAARSYAAVVERRQAWLTVVESLLPGGEILPYRRLSLPLSGDGRRVDRVLGVVDWDARPVGSRPFFEVYDEAVERRRREAVCDLG